MDQELRDQLIEDLDELDISISNESVRQHWDTFKKYFPSVTIDEKGNAYMQLSQYATVPVNQDEQHVIAVLEDEVAIGHVDSEIYWVLDKMLWALNTADVPVHKLRKEQPAEYIKLLHKLATILKSLEDKKIISRRDNHGVIVIGLILTEEQRQQLMKLKVIKHTVKTFCRKLRWVYDVNGKHVVLDKKLVHKIEAGAFKMLSLNCPASKDMGTVEYQYDLLARKYVHLLAKAIIIKSEEAYRRAIIEMDEEDENLRRMQKMLKSVQDKVVIKDGKRVKIIAPRRLFMQNIIQMLTEKELILIANCNGVDSRFRGIIGDGKKIFSWQTLKLLRAFLLCPPEDLTDEGYESLCIFVYSLTKINRLTSRKAMIAWGDAVLNQDGFKFKMPEDLFEKFWLKRILIQWAKWGRIGWDIPIECDQTAEVLATMGAVFGIPQLLHWTNVVSFDGDTVNDAWTITNKKGDKLIDRTLVKKVITMIAYGASAFDIKGLCERVVRLGYVPSFSQDDIKCIQALIGTGYDQKYADVYNKFACVKFIGHFLRLMTDDKRIEFHIDMSEDLHFTLMAQKGTRVYDPVMGKANDPEEFNVSDLGIGLSRRNKWDQRGYIDVVKVDRKLGVIVVDASSMRRYFVTCLIHCLGARLSQMVMNELLTHGHWILNNHDAHVVHPNSGKLVSTTLQRGYIELFTKREQILKAYITSLNIQEYNAAKGTYHTLTYQDMADAYAGRKEVWRGETTKDGSPKDRCIYKCGEFISEINAKDFDVENPIYDGIEAMVNGFNINA